MKRLRGLRVSSGFLLVTLVACGNEERDVVVSPSGDAAVEVSDNRWSGDTRVVVRSLVGDGDAEETLRAECARNLSVTWQSDSTVVLGVDGLDIRRFGNTVYLKIGYGEYRRVLVLVEPNLATPLGTCATP